MTTSKRKTGQLSRIRQKVEGSTPPQTQAEARAAAGGGVTKDASVTAGQSDHAIMLDEKYGDAARIALAMEDEEPTAEQAFITLMEEEPAQVGGQMRQAPESLFVPAALADRLFLVGSTAEIITASEWTLALLVWLDTEDGGKGGRPSKTGEKSPVSKLSFSAYAKLGIRGLTTHRSVARYHRAWQRAIDAKLVKASACVPGSYVTLPEITWADFMAEPEVAADVPEVAAEPEVPTEPTPIVPPVVPPTEHEHDDTPDPRYTPERIVARIVNSAAEIETSDILTDDVTTGQAKAMLEDLITHREYVDVLIAALDARVNYTRLS